MALSLVVERESWLGLLLAEHLNPSQVKPIENNPINTLVITLNLPKSKALVQSPCRCHAAQRIKQHYLILQLSRFLQRSAYEQFCRATAAGCGRKIQTLQLACTQYRVCSRGKRPDSHTTYSLHAACP